MKEQMNERRKTIETWLQRRAVNLKKESLNSWIEWIAEEPQATNIQLRKDLLLQRKKELYEIELYTKNKIKNEKDKKEKEREMKRKRKKERRAQELSLQKQQRQQHWSAVRLHKEQAIFVMVQYCVEEFVSVSFDFDSDVDVDLILI